MCPTGTPGTCCCFGSRIVAGFVSKYLHPETYSFTTFEYPCTGVNVTMSFPRLVTTRYLSVSTQSSGTNSSHQMMSHSPPSITRRSWA